MNQIIPASFGAVSNKFANTQATDDLSSGIQSSFGLIGFKGKVWSIRYRGEEKALMRDDGDGPRNSIEVVVLKASTTVSKIWYKDGYVEGSNASPDCFSNNGVTPEPSSKLKQCDNCASCPMNQWGSRITPAGKQGKACADSKRLAVVPEQDMLNEAYGGPMLLRVPAASLQDIALYGQKMQQMGYPYYAVVTKIAFDAEESYPKFIFTGVRPLTDAEADIVITHRDGHQVQRILSESEYDVATAAQGENVPAGTVTAGVTQNTNNAPAGVGAQARAAAEAIKAQNTAKTVEQPKVEPVKEAPKTVEQPKVEPVKAATAAAPAMDEALAKKLKGMILAGFDEAEAKKMLGIVDAPAAAPEPDPIDPKVAAVMEATGMSREDVETMLAARAANAARTAKEEPKTIEQPVVEAATVTSQGNGTVVEASAFEGDLDDMLSKLLPG